jgi:hypothetical protein
MSPSRLNDNALVEISIVRALVVVVIHLVQPNKEHIRKDELH